MKEEIKIGIMCVVGFIIGIVFMGCVFSSYNVVVVDGERGDVLTVEYNGVVYVLDKLKKE